ncbi:hypothetical protein SmJEL517_g04889 [Synchytrium microbalum]|uniref:Transcription factor CBF/NF-Y/archaeal histone domain-containing protein n=1 Tax=Synchytrium microbalum TaxID=1806994 RepID=A0A507BWP2_9FUNG|nr:uncharacterized protein SmJEL517_g04889 [Synchytrium microbalum]TPX31872.1 hypothetical protein SmJEL517_g04889 [Synchytrium microbalum]
MPPKKGGNKTRFPQARIKRIMRIDEEVGKVAQATPILISKAVEMFLETVVEEMCKVTQSKNAKRVTPAHLKQTIMAQERFDFLREKVQNLADTPGTELPAQEDGDPKKKKKKASAKKPKQEGGEPSKPTKPRKSKAAVPTSDSQGEEDVALTLPPPPLNAPKPAGTLPYEAPQAVMAINRILEDEEDYDD